jgi:cytochrome c biogenesis protein CcmG, thiol:disulfide interchange protein DsbE
VIALAALLSVAAPSETPGQRLPPQRPATGRSVGNLAYDFTLKDLDGRSYTLKQMRGKRVVHVVFWATWCVPCLQEIPRLRSVYQGQQGRGLQVLGVVVNLSQTPDMVRAVAQDFKVNYPILFDTDGSIANRYGVSMIPQNFLIGKDGIIRFAGTSLPRNYEAMVERLLHEDGAAPSAK